LWQEKSGNPGVPSFVGVFFRRTLLGSSLAHSSLYSWHSNHWARTMRCPERQLGCP
jgi:hypothetical protein